MISIFNKRKNIINVIDKKQGKNYIIILIHRVKLIYIYYKLIN